MDKIYTVNLYLFGEGEPPFEHRLVQAESEEHAYEVYLSVKDKLPDHSAISIREYTDKIESGVE